VNVDAGEFLKRDGHDATVVHRLEDNGTVTIAASRSPGAKGVSGQGSVCVLTFRAAAAGDSSISFDKVGAKNSSQTAISANGTAAVVHVK